MYIGNQPVLQTSEFREEFTATAGQTVFNTLGFAYSSDSAFVEIFRNGVLLATEDYTLGTDGTTVTLSDACSLNDIVLVKGRRAITQGISITESRTEYTWQSGDTYVQLNADIVPGYADVYLNGVKLPSAEFSIDTGTKRVTFTTTPSIGDEVSVVYRTETSSLVALPLKDSAGNTILSESGGTVTLENASLGDTVLMPDNSNNISTAPGIRFEADTDTGIGLASAGNLAIVTGGSERLRVDSNGNVGINTSSPASLLDVASSGEVIGTIRSTSTSGTRQATLRLNVPSAGTNDPAGKVQFTYGSGYSVAGSIEMTHTSTNMKFFTGTTERMRIDSSGNVLIGYTSSNGSYKLQVNSQIFATSAIIATSDGRYKENITSLDGALNLVAQLNPVQFTWKEHPVHEFDRNQPTVGFIAQEVQEVLKDTPYVNSIIKANECLVGEERDEEGNIITEGTTEEFLGIAEGNLIALLTKALQEANAKIDALETRIQALEVPIGE